MEKKNAKKRKHIRFDEEDHDPQPRQSENMPGTSRPIVPENDTQEFIRKKKEFKEKLLKDLKECRENSSDDSILSSKSSMSSSSSESESDTMVKEIKPVDILKKVVTTKKRTYQRRFRPCPLCDKDLNRDFKQHFNKFQKDSDYKKYRNGLRLPKKFQYENDIEMFDWTIIDDIEKNETIPIRKKLKQIGFYEEIRKEWLDEGSPIMDYSDFLEHLVHTKLTNIGNYRRYIGRIFKFCCPDVEVLSMRIVAEGLVLNVMCLFAMLTKVGSFSLANGYTSKLIRFLNYAIQYSYRSKEPDRQQTKQKLMDVLANTLSMQKIFSKKSRIQKAIEAASVDTVAPMSYKECLSFIRDERVLAHFRDICVRNGHISKSDYNFALYFISAMVLYVNGARPEVIYKSKLKYIRKFTDDGGIEYELIKLPDAKCGLSMTVMSPDIRTYFDLYQSLRKKYAEQKNVEDNSGFTFVNRKFEALDHHISDRIIDTIRTYNVQNGTNFPLVGAYQVRRASVTSAVMKVTKDFEEAIAEGEIDIGQNVRAHSGRTSFRNYHKTRYEELAIKSYKILRQVENGNEPSLAEVFERPKNQGEAVDIVRALQEDVNINSSVLSEEDDESPLSASSKFLITGSKHPLLIKIERAIETRIPFQNFLQVQTRTKEKWNKSLPWKTVLKSGKPSRYFTDGWRRAAEKFLERKTKFAAVPNSLSVCDELIPDVEIANASTGERSSKKSQAIQESGAKPEKGQKNEAKRPTLNVLRKLVYANLKHYLARIQSVALFVFLRYEFDFAKLEDDECLEILRMAARRLDLEFSEPDRKLISTFKIAALSMADPLFDQTRKSNDSHRSQSVEPHNVTPTPVKILPSSPQTNTPRPNKSRRVINFDESDK